MTDDLVDRTVRLLRAQMPGAAVELRPRGDDQRIDLPFAAEAEYRFYLWFYATGDREIGAERIDSAGEVLASDCSFWYHPFERPDYEDSPDRLAQAYDSEMLSLLHVPTRVRQRRGWLMSTLCLDREATPGGWVRVYQYSALFLIRVERTPTPDHIFAAPPVVGAKRPPPGV